MKRTILFRMISGLFVGIVISYLITIAISLCVGDGSYYPCVPSLTEQFHSEITAIVIQTILSAFLGAGFGGSSVIWEIEGWGILKQTGIYFAIVSVLMMTVAYVLHWMEHSVIGVLKYFSLFFAIFVVVWIVQYCIWRKKIEALNGKIKEIE